MIRGKGWVCPYSHQESDRHLFKKASFGHTGMAWDQCRLVFWNCVPGPFHGYLTGQITRKTALEER